jgi:hypothetical protein
MYSLLWIRNDSYESGSGSLLASHFESGFGSYPKTMETKKQAYFMSRDFFRSNLESGSDQTKLFRIRMQNANHYVYVYSIYKPNAVCVPMNGVNGICGMLWRGVVANSVIVFNKIITPIVCAGRTT